MSWYLACRLVYHANKSESDWINVTRCRPIVYSSLVSKRTASVCVCVCVCVCVRVRADVRWWWWRGCSAVVRGDPRGSDDCRRHLRRRTLQRLLLSTTSQQGRLSQQPRCWPTDLVCVMCVNEAAIGSVINRHDVCEWTETIYSVAVSPLRRWVESWSLKLLSSLSVKCTNAQCTVLYQTLLELHLTDGELWRSSTSTINHVIIAVCPCHAAASSSRPSISGRCQSVSTHPVY